MSNAEVLTSAVSRYLFESGFEIITSNESPFSLMAQNESVLVFVVNASSDLSSAVERTLSSLVRPFRNKSFGPKTLEMYTLFLLDEVLPITQLEKYEKDVRVCRKIVLTGLDEIDTRLAFLRPLEPTIVQAADLDELFWSRLQDRVTLTQFDVLRSLDTSELTLEELWVRVARTK
jgi:hypothetical protein